jgi:branched-chain amino acid transport system ATP-binding protein
MQRDLLRIEHLTKNFGGIHAVNNLNMSVGNGEIVAIIGPNGSGKTTLFNLIVHLYDTTAGKIYFGDPPVDIARVATHAINALGVARTFQTLRLFPNLTVVENVLVGMSARLRGGPLNAVMQTLRTRREEAEAEA